MVDLSITEEVLADGKVRYRLGEPNWAGRRIPDIHRPGSTIQIRTDRMIDVIILGDGFTDRATFRAELEDWLAAFYGFPIYETFAGCFRIRALYTPSNQAASAARGSYYRCWISSTGRALEAGDNVDWPNSPAAEDVAFRDAIWRSVDLFTDANLRRYPASLDIGDSDQALTNAGIRDRYRNLVVSLLVRSALPDTDPPGFDLHVSGRVIDIPRSAPNQAIHMAVAVGALELHEFGHAFAQLADEYIKTDYRGRGYEGDDAREPPSPTSVFSLSNLWFSNLTPEVPWIHLSPGGWQRRTASGQDPSPLVGWMWVGGMRQHGVWHAEYMCLMNGGHHNFAFTQVAADDPTIDDGVVKGADLRGRAPSFCLWCQEIVAIRILEKTDQLLEAGDSSDITTQGTLWWDRWVERLRANYRTLLNVDQQILDAESRYAAMFPGKNGEPLWRSDLYAVPTAPTPPAASPGPSLTGEELLLLTAAALP